MKLLRLHFERKDGTVSPIAIMAHHVIAVYRNNSQTIIDVAAADGDHSAYYLVAETMQQVVEMLESA